MTPDQCIWARSALRWSRAKLAGEAGVGIHVIEGFEVGGVVMRPQSLQLEADRLLAIRTALEEAGVEFSNDGAPGVRLRSGPAQ